MIICDGGSSGNGPVPRIQTTNKYRVVQTAVDRFDPQVRRRWWPFWRSIALPEKIEHGGYVPRDMQTLQSARIRCFEHAKAVAKPIPAYPIIHPFIPPR